MEKEIFMKLSMKVPSFHQHNYFHGIIIICAFAFLLFSCHQSSNSGKRATSFQYIHEVNPMIGTGARGMIVPAALVPFGMVQLGPDTRHWGSGYHYQDDSIQGFSHVHKSGAGCGDFLDILFQPVSEPVRLKKGLKKEYASSFSHAKEKATVGLYQVHLDNFEIDVALTATKRCGFHQYTYSGNSQPGVVIDLKHGNVGACTIIKEDGYDTVMTSYLEIIDPHTIQGYKISSGWAEEQHVYFYTKFSRPIAAYQFSDAGEAFDGKILESTDIKALLNFTLDDPERTLLVKTGISSVSMESARKNLESEIKDWDFDHVVQKAQMAWENQLSKIGIKGGTKDQRTSFYSALYHAFTYPMLYSDVEGYYRGGDFNVHKTKGHDNYNGVMSLWDTFR